MLHQQIFQSQLCNSFNATIENTPTPLVSVPVIVTLGILIVLFIIVVMFRQQIATGMELAWDKD